MLSTAYIATLGKVPQMVRNGARTTMQRAQSTLSALWGVASGKDRLQSTAKQAMIAAPNIRPI